MEWQESLEIFLEAQDPRWRSLLDAIEKRGFTMLDETMEKEIAAELGIEGQRRAFKKQLYTYLTSYTSDGIRNRVLAGKVEGSW